MRIGTIVAAVLGLAACGPRGQSGESESASPVVCTMEARSSFAVTVMDSISSRSLAPAATVRVTEGSFTDTLIGNESMYSGGVYERPGTYAVSVTHPGYQTWQRNGVRVAKDECHVITERLTARLRPR